MDDLALNHQNDFSAILQMIADISLGRIVKHILKNPRRFLLEKAEGEYHILEREEGI